MTVYQTISRLVEAGLTARLIEETDRTYVRNQVAGLLGLRDFEPSDPESETPIPDLLENLVAFAVEQQVIENVFDEKEMLAAKIMDCFTPRPSVVNETFYQKYEQSPEQATDYFYALSKNNNYIQTKRIRQNIHFKADTSYGELDITINLSKPEKDPEQIKREKEMKQTISYPRCLLCAENEGYVGRTGYPARSNHRVIKVPLEGENWYFQYSPYVYYNEHCIVLAEEHREMKVDRHTFERLTAFVDRFPHYFIGSNADLPIVGGSILSHDHYQGGCYRFAMEKAEDDFTFPMDRFPDARASVIHWPMSVIRLRSSRKENLVEAAAHILEKWRTYSDKSAGIIAETNGVPHNTITPIARKQQGQYEMDLVLRNNRTSEEHPNGVFHPHQDVHHIKKENIGLIEVMGLAVLPPRLKKELAELRRWLLGKPAELDVSHKPWAENLKKEYDVKEDNVDQIIETALGRKFSRVLEDAGVFKREEAGKKAFQRFSSILNE